MRRVARILISTASASNGGPDAQEVTLIARRAEAGRRARLAGVVSLPAVTHRLDRASPRNGAKTARRSPALRGNLRHHDVIPARSVSEGQAVVRRTSSEG